MAEQLVIISIDQQGAQTILEAARSNSATLLQPQQGRTLTLVSINDDSALPTLDPDHGWLLPLNNAVREELLHVLTKPGEYELESINAAIIFT